MTWEWRPWHHNVTTFSWSLSSCCLPQLILLCPAQYREKWHWGCYITASTIAKARLSINKDICSRSSKIVIMRSTLTWLWHKIWLAFMCHNLGRLCQTECLPQTIHSIDKAMSENGDNFTCHNLYKEFPSLLCRSLLWPQQHTKQETSAHHYIGNMSSILPVLFYVGQCGLIFFILASTSLSRMNMGAIHPPRHVRAIINSVLGVLNAYKWLSYPGRFS